MNANSIADKVINLVARETGSDVRKISLQTELCRNLGVDGDDGIELMEKFGQEFRVDMQKFDFGRYFGPEAGFCPFLIFFPSWWRWRRQFKPLTIADLVKAAESGVCSPEEEG